MNLRFDPQFRTPTPLPKPPVDGRTPLVPRPLEVDPAAPAGSNAAQGVGDSGPTAPQPDPAKRIEALVDQLRERVTQRMERRDVDDRQREAMRELFGSFEQAMANIAEDADGLSPEEIAQRVHDVLTRAHSAAEGLLGTDKTDGPSPDPSGAAPDLDALGQVASSAESAAPDPLRPRPDDLETRPERTPGVYGPTGRREGNSGADPFQLLDDRM